VCACVRACVENRLVWFLWAPETTLRAFSDGVVAMVAKTFITSLTRLLKPRRCSWIGLLPISLDDSSSFTLELTLLVRLVQGGKLRSRRFTASTVKPRKRLSRLRPGMWSLFFHSSPQAIHSSHPHSEPDDSEEEEEEEEKVTKRKEEKAEKDVDVDLIDLVKEEPKVETRLMNNYFSIGISH